MKYILSIFLLSSSILASQLETLFDYKKAINLAQKENKILLMMLETSNCGWCKKMKQTTLKSENIVNSINQDMIFVRIDRDADIYPSKFYSRFVPTVFAINPYINDEFDMAIGYQNSERFSKFLDSIKKDFNTIKQSNLTKN